MKNSDSKKKIADLENQKVDSAKIQGGGARPEPIKLTKDQVASFDEPQQNNAPASGFTSNVHSDGSILSKRGIRTPKSST